MWFLLPAGRRRSAVSAQFHRAYLQLVVAGLQNGRAYIHGAFYHSTWVVSSCGVVASSSFLSLLRLGSLMACLRRYSRSSCIRFTRTTVNFSPSELPTYNRSSLYHFNDTSTILQRYFNDFLSLNYR